MSKPTSKVIQISTCGVQNVNGTQCDYMTTALCEDGSIWEQRNVSYDWNCILEAPTQILNLKTGNVSKRIKGVNLIEK